MQPTKADVAELAERRASAKRNPHTIDEAGTQSPAQSDDWRSRIRAAARRDRTMRFNNLMHHVTVPLLWEAYRHLKPKAAAGADGVDWEGYGKALGPNRKGLHERVHTGRYRPQPVKRQWIDKADGGTRPLGITCVE